MALFHVISRADDICPSRKLTNLFPNLLMVAFAINCFCNLKNDFLFYRLRDGTDGRRGQDGWETDETVSRTRDKQLCNPDLDTMTTIVTSIPSSSL